MSERIWNVIWLVHGGGAAVLARVAGRLDGVQWIVYQQSDRLLFGHRGRHCDALSTRLLLQLLRVHIWIVTYVVKDGL